MDMNLLKYRAFVATVEDGSFTRAAEQLHYSQSGISRMIADLEREWNLTLLEKGAKAEIAALFERYHLQPNVHFTTWDDYAVMSMVESGLGGQHPAGADPEAGALPHCYPGAGCARAAHHRVLPAGQKERFACGEALSGISRFSRRKNSTAMRENTGKLKKCRTKFCGMCRISLEKLDILPNK